MVYQTDRENNHHRHLLAKFSCPAIASMFGDAFEADPAELEVDPSAEDVDENQTWTVISSFFNEKGLVRQQLDSFNEFVGNTIQEIVDETPEIVIKPEAQYVPGELQSWSQGFIPGNIQATMQKNGTGGQGDSPE